MNSFRHWDQNLLSDVHSSLLDELPLPDNVPGGMVKYRKSLTLRYGIFVLIHHLFCLYLILSNTIINQIFFQFHSLVFKGFLRIHEKLQSTLDIRHHGR